MEFQEEFREYQDESHDLKVNVQEEFSKTFFNPGRNRALSDGYRGWVSGMVDIVSSTGIRVTLDNAMQNDIMVLRWAEVEAIV